MNSVHKYIYFPVLYLLMPLFTCLFFLSYKKYYNSLEQVEADEEYFETSLEVLKNGDYSLSIVITGIRCAACIWLIESLALKDERIKSFRINYANHKAKIVFNPNDISVKEVL